MSVAVQEVDLQNPKPDPAPDRKAAIRKYRPGDREAVREICRRTAFRNIGADAVFEDGELFADYWCRYYTDYEPESAWVAELDGEVVGYLVGCLDTKRYVRTMARSIVPKIMVLLLWRYAGGRYRDQQSRRFLRWLFLKSWREAPSIDLKKYRVHFHINFISQEGTRNLFSRMATIFLDYTDEMGQDHLNAGLLVPRQRSGWERMIQEYKRERPQGVEFESEKATDIGRDVLGLDRELVNRVYGVKTSEFRRFLDWTAKRYRF